MCAPGPTSDGVQNSTGPTFLTKLPHTSLSHFSHTSLSQTLSSHTFSQAYAKALEVIPRQLCNNAGFDATDVLNMLRQKHAAADGAGKNFGVDVNTGGVVDTFDAFVWEPSLVKVNALASATEAACLILSVDETVRNPKSEVPDAMSGAGAAGAMGGRGRGRGAPRGRGMRR